MKHLALIAALAAASATTATAQTLTRPQQNAVRSAEKYLGFAAFSKPGLIGLLSSPNGDGYDVADATAAVNSLTVDWHAQAARAAEKYLEMIDEIAPFSRRGFIDQLSSPYYDGFEVADATAAVKSLTVDWHAQAARAAENYLEMKDFSCNGLIDQLSSDAGDQYTRSEAAYGAQQAGAC